MAEAGVDPWADTASLLLRVVVSATRMPVTLAVVSQSGHTKVLEEGVFQAPYHPIL